MPAAILLSSKPPAAATCSSSSSSTGQPPATSGTSKGKKVVLESTQKTDQSESKFSLRMCATGDVRYWITLNEPWCACALGYGSGEHAPGHREDAGKEPYLAAHHMLLAHARAVKCYRHSYQHIHGGSIVSRQKDGTKFAAARIPRHLPRKPTEPIPSLHGLAKSLLWLKKAMASGMAFASLGRPWPHQVQPGTAAERLQRSAPSGAPARDGSLRSSVATATFAGLAAGLRNSSAGRRGVSRAAGTAGPTPIQEVMHALEQVKDPDMGTDIVSSGFVGQIKAERITGNISLVLEVEMYKAEVEERLSQIPWAKSVEVRVGAVRQQTSATNPPRPMPQMPDSLKNVKTILAVSSCKGGVGKSTVAVNLAFSLYQKGYKVGIFDCDVYGPSLPVMLRFQEDTPKMEMYQDEQKQKHIRPVIDPNTGIKMVSFGFVGHAAVMRGSMVTGVMSQLVTQTDWGELDYLVLDMPPGTGDIHLTLSQVCQITAAVIVTTPQKLSVIDVERGISMFSQLNVPSVAVVQNMSYMSLPNGERQYIFGQTDAGYAIADTFGIEQVFELPIEASVAAAGDSGKPFGNKGDSETAKQMDKLTEAVITEVEKIHDNRQQPELSWDGELRILRLKLAGGEELGIDPRELRLRDKGAGGVTPPPADLSPDEIVDMGNYAVVIKWSDGVVQVAPHKWPGSLSTETREVPCLMSNWRLPEARTLKSDVAGVIPAYLVSETCITLNMDWKEPLSDSAADQAAQRRALDWQLGWFADPIYKGAYPATMRERCGDRLPEFSDEEVAMLKGSSDFFGLNHYSTDFVSQGEDGPPAVPNYFADQDVRNVSDPRWQRTDMGWDIVPWGFEKLLSWIQKEYDPTGGILVTENGCAVRENTEAEAVQDTARVEYLQGYLAQLHKAMANGAVIKGYLVWSLLDNFEWAFGYAKRFGIVRVDFTTQQRTPKASAQLISDLCKGGKLKVPSRVQASSEFFPYNGRGKEPEVEPKKVAAPPALSKADAKRMLEEFVMRYQDDHFQSKMVSCFQQYLIHNDEMRLLKARRSLCMPIQAEIIPKYGFEPTARGVSRVQATLSAPALTEDPDIKQMNELVVYLTGDFPKTKAAEGATV
ncbi:Beta-glucosidase 4 [Symbiodinium microadriaticum]|uniref:Beta-glucosidase 4 n=1 Tax=Symbiodinium microadriaticum TaxID=2951 RepID=A0A1Q9ECG9_SYMMI|nr:Beta-glucosidase 4 [Symbiodinium microadriaticum]